MNKHSSLLSVLILINVMDDNHEKYLASWHKNLLQKESEINYREYELKIFEKNLDEVIKKESENLVSNRHCACCKNNLSLQPDSVYMEWGFFKKTSGSEIRIGTTYIGEVYFSDTFSNIFYNWVNTDEIGKNYRNSKLKSVFVTKLDLSWTANDWRIVGNLNSKIKICEVSKRFKMKFIISE